MNIDELEIEYGALPSTIDRKKMSSLLKKKDSIYPCVKDLQKEVTEWIDTLNINSDVIDYDIIDHEIKNLKSEPEIIKLIKFDNKLVIVLIDNYKVFNKKNVNKNIAGDIHQDLLKTYSRVVWCKKFEWENLKKRQVIKSLVLHILGLTTNRVFARNTICEIIEPNLLKDFFDKSSFYGNRNASHAVCLRDKKTNEVLQAMSFGHAYYAKQKYGDNVIECIRSAGKPFSIVVGGMSKLMKFWMENCPVKFDTCIYYVDNSHHHSDSMDAVNFKFSHFAGGGVHNVWEETGAMFMRTPALHKEIMYLQSLGEIYGVPDVGNDVYLFKREEVKEVVDEGTDSES